MEICIGLYLGPPYTIPSIFINPNSIGVGIGRSLSLGQCKHTIRIQTLIAALYCVENVHIE